MVNGGLENKFVNKNFISETKRWEGLFKNVFKSNSYDSIKLNKSSNSSYARVSKPLLRECRDIPETGRKNVSGGGLAGNLGKYEIKAVVRGYVNLNGDLSRPFELGYSTDGGCRDPILLKLGTGITDIASPRHVADLDSRINELGEDLRREFCSEAGACEFLKEYLSICDNFVTEVFDENNYNNYLEKVDCLNPRRI